MKKRGLLLIMFLIIIGAQGCELPQSYPIEEIQNILVVGIDIEDEDIIFTVVVDTLTKGGKPGEEQTGTKIYTATGRTIAEAKRNLHRYIEKRLSLYHLAYIIIGQKAAEQEMAKSLNCFLEIDESSLLIKLFVTKEMTAQEFIEKTNEEKANLADNLTSLIEETIRTAKASKVILLDYAIKHERAWEDFYIPTIQKYSNPLKESIGDEKKQGPSYKLEGYAIFKDDKLNQYLNGDSARGLNFLLDEVKSTVITIKDVNDKYVSFETIDSKTKIVPKVKNTSLSATVEVDVKSNFLEYYEKKDMLTEKYLNDLKQKHSEVIKKEIEQALFLLQKEETDVIGMGDAFFHKDPKKWRDINANWQDIFSTLNITVKVNVYIQGSYYLDNALGQ